jgi:hypothetical protein
LSITIVIPNTTSGFATIVTFVQHDLILFLRELAILINVVGHQQLRQSAIAETASLVLSDAAHDQCQECE